MNINSKENAIRKINKLGKVGYVLSIIVRVFVIIALVGTIIGTIILSIMPKDSVKLAWGGDIRIEVDVPALLDKFNIPNGDEKVQKEIDKVIESGNFSLNNTDYIFADVSSDNGKVILNAEAGNPRIINLSDIRNITIVAVVYLVLFLVTIIFVGKLCKAVRDCRSPFEENVISRITKLAFAMIPWTIADSVSQNLFDVFSGNTSSLNFSVNIGMIITVLVIFALAFVFKYGAALQQESDETL